MGLMKNDDFRKLSFENLPFPVIIMDANARKCFNVNKAAFTLTGLESQNMGLSKTFLDISAKTQSDGSISEEKLYFYINKALNDGSTRFEWIFLRPDGHLWNAEIYLQCITFNDEQYLQFTIVDITERRLEEKNQRLLNDLILGLDSSTTIHEGLEKILKTVLQFECFDSGGIYLADPSNNSLTIEVHSGLSEKYITLTSHYKSDSWNAHIAAAGKTVYGNYSDIMDTVYQQEGLRAIALIPIMSQGKLITIMCLASHKTDIIPEKTRTALETIASQIGGSLQRLRTEVALRESEEIFRVFMEKSPVYVFFKDEKIRTIKASANFEQMLGIPANDILGKTMDEIFPSDFAKKMVLDDSAILSEGKSVTIDEEFNGRYYTSIKFPIHLEGKPRYLAGYTIDITDRKLTENALKESVDQFQAFMDNMTSMAVIKDSNQRLLFYNKEFFKYFTADKWLGKTPEEIFPPEIATVIQKGDMDAFEKGSTVYEEDLVDKFGTVRTFEASKFIIKRKDSGPNLGVILTDITERKQTEKALSNTQKLESLGVLAGGIAHDFNNLLGGIFGYIDLARSDISQDKRDEFLSKALSTIDRARALTLQLLTFAKGGAPVKNIENFFPFVQEAVQFALSGTSVSCNFTFDDKLWQSEFDKNQISQVVDNIVINAVQAMPGGGTIEVSVQNKSFADKKHPVLPLGNYVCISVQDRGVGIPKECLSRIFDPFYTTKPKGHGLGLTTCYSIITRHGGCIDVKSKPGKGTTFTIYLPALNSINTTINTPVVNEHIGNGIFLVMDDEQIMRETLGQILESFGYTVILTENGKEAIERFTAELCANHTLAGMIFDLTIPGCIGGKDAISEIRKLSEEIPVFVASGYGDDPVMANPGHYGFTASICKPFRKSELADLLNRHLKT